MQSSLFKKADRQSRFLRYVVEKHLSGDASEIAELSIGLDVYDRPPAYDPRTDPIVRVEASRLRSRLREYYEVFGADDAIRIDIPKGSYVPTFERRVANVTQPVLEAVPEAPLEAVAAPPVSRSPMKKVWLIGAGVGVLALAGIGLALLRPRPPARTKPIDSIAVLSFADLSEKKDLAYLADGLTEQIQEELGRIRDLRVVGSTSAKQVSASPDLRAAARQIGVDSLLQGSVRAEDQKVRVTVRLLDGSSGAAIWSGSFDGERKGLFRLEDQIAEAVAGKLSIQLAVRREGIDARMAPQRAQAHEYVEKARVLSEKESAGGWDEIRRLYELAAATDPSYAPAHVGIANALIVSGGADTQPRALQEVKRALELDPGLPSAHSALILYYRDTEMDWAKARAACNSSLQKLPNSLSVLQMCGSVQGILMNHAEELQLMRRGIALDPLSPRMHGSFMLALYQAGHFEEALNEADEAIRLGSISNFVYRHRALILAAKGDPAGGLKVIEDAQSRLGGVPSDWLPIRGYLLGLLKRRVEAEHVLAEVTLLPNQIGLIYLGLGERTKALDSFERSMQTDRATMGHAVSEYYMRELDGDPRFEAMKRKLGLLIL